MMSRTLLLLTVTCLTAVLLFPTSAVRAGEGKVIMPFNGVDLKGWKLKGKNSKWVVGRLGVDPAVPTKWEVVEIPAAADGGPAARYLINKAGPGGTDIFTEEKFGDCTVELEFVVPKGSNSGVYLLGEYEVQILDSYGKDRVGPGDVGGLYGAAAPRVNAARKPGEWQKFVIDFQAPRFENGKKISNARFLKVTLNDQVIHENVEMKGPTTACLTGKEAATGPLMLQGDHGPVAFRNLRITPRK